MEVNLNFQVRLIIILANGIFPGRIYRSFNGNIHSLLQIFAEPDLQIIIKHFFVILFLLKTIVGVP